MHKRYFIASLLLGVLLVVPAPLLRADELDLYGCPTETTPFDRKVGLHEAMTPPYPNGRSCRLPSLHDLFWKARTFAYVRDPGRDEWQAPEVTERRKAGDCEDKALWLYTKLRAAGYDNLRLVVGRFRPVDAVYHVWVTYEDARGVTHLLDPTLQNRVWNLASVSAGFYRPIFSYDGWVRYRHAGFTPKQELECEEFLSELERMRAPAAAPAPALFRLPEVLPIVKSFFAPLRLSRREAPGEDFES
jgi:hypothetical protein